MTVQPLLSMADTSEVCHASQRRQLLPAISSPRPAPVVLLLCPQAAAARSRQQRLVLSPTVLRSQCPTAPRTAMRWPSLSLLLLLWWTALAALLCPCASLRQVVVPLPPHINPVASQLTAEVEARVQQTAADLPIAQKARLLDLYQGSELLTDGRLDEAKIRSLSGGLGLGSVHDFYPPTAAVANQLQRLIINDTEAAIPVLFIEECLHGYQQGGHTSFPAPLGLAATWHPELVERMAQSISREARAFGIRMCLAPVLGAAREPRWGRSEETSAQLTAQRAHSSHCSSSRLLC